MIAGQRKISSLFAACFFFVLAVSIGFSSVVLHRLAGLQSQARELHQHSLSITHSGQEMLANLSRMHNLVLQTILAPEASRRNDLSATLRTLDTVTLTNNSQLYLDTVLRGDLAVASSESAEIRALEGDVSRQLDAWHATHLRILDLARHNHRTQALALAASASIPTYTLLYTRLEPAVLKVQARAASLAAAAAGSANTAIREAWWILGALVLLNILCGATALRRIGLIMKDDARLVTRLHENEQRLQMALAGGNQGTWDLDVPTGKLNFDAQWGNLLGYPEQRDRPSTIGQWADRIFSEDRERVLAAVHNHIAGRAPEYRAEYRMLNQAGEVRWVAGHGKAMHRDSSGKATRVVGITQDITQRKLFEQEIWAMAHTDILTGLPNRVRLYDRLTQMIAYARRHGQMFALFFLDLDGFKAVNDKYGHDIGDKLLQEVAARLGEVIRSEDTMARVGGDEFIFLLNGVRNRDDAATVANKILGMLRDEFFVNECRCRIGGSIGIAIYPEHGVDMDTLVSRADDAMYQAKAKGKNNFQFFQAEADDTSTGGSAAA